ncbi:HTH-type transcriptional activator RhaS [Paraburkholderia domus]|uniref:HTH-type transcriptional activator RhaS n=1 Tax=Paraburkholderia domus TaxID=2793075 RepID=A0A9N8QV13_9BURK|nr:AraC family transcriptional regulator [Paraburkholderia domus]MBK5048744.1 helix-turn-helix transcriptional regulator [Burkholderia sp. R-70006]MBK5065454.1 helix-turn-helix transcriptional regulator [Burkholderia sp. R-70199]MBK5090480.1 helix-turn-helix transcriptional regulator [Burkholderia sp. R-69927]MBK5120132.1 helix-turn-helix transcriptional regulator [Burkholderia sp. R-69980]MBK5165576.1 helix-turn-helix transcriptional regulator [Burkholderia sp. R-70211]MBK5184780.1 helix-tur
MARIPKLTTTLAYDRYMAGQKLVSSVDRPWRHLVLRSYLEPAEVELLEAPGLQDVTLMTLGSGAEHLERNLNGRWESADLRVGDVWFVPPVPISWRWRSLSDEPLSTVHLHLERSLIDSVADQMELDGSRELSLGDAMQFHDPLIAAMLGSLHRAAGDPADSRLYVDALAHALAAHLLQHYSRGRHAKAGLPPQPERLVPRRIRRVTDYIRANLAADLSISELAAHAGLSSFHFARVFRRETGETPHQFVSRLRLEEAARLLRATDQPVLQIALAVGFENASHFSVQFKRDYGVTPLAYRLRG